MNFDLNAKELYTGNTAFHLACNNSNSKIVEMLIKKSTEFNIDLNAKDVFGETAFHHACRNGHSLIVETLIQNSTEFNIDLNAITKQDGYTPFHIACLWGGKKIIKIMMDNAKVFKLNLMKKDNYGRTGFQCAKYRGHNY